MRFARSNNAAKRQPERATPWHRMLKDAKDDDDEDSNEAAASSAPSDLAPKRKSVEPDEEEVKAAANVKVSKVEGATDVTTKATQNAAKKDVEDVSDDDGAEDDDGSEGDDDDAEGADDDDVEGAGDSEDDDEEDEEDDDEDAKPAKKSSPKAAKGNGKGTEKQPISTGPVCFKCREGGHLMKDCPKMKPDEDGNICYICGSTEHFAYKCKVKSKESMPYAKCFICNKMGHIARFCPQKKFEVNPNGAKCKLCDSDKHFKSDCPMFKNKNKQEVVVAKRGATNKSADLDDNFVEPANSHRESLSHSSKKTKKIVKF